MIFKRHATPHRLLLFRHPDGAETALADLLEQLVMADPIAGFFGLQSRQLLFDLCFDGHVLRSGALFMRTEQIFDIAHERFVIRASFRDELLAFVCRAFERLEHSELRTVSRVAHGVGWGRRPFLPGCQNQRGRSCDSSPHCPKGVVPFILIFPFAEVAFSASAYAKNGGQLCGPDIRMKATTPFGKPTPFCKGRACARHGGARADAKRNFRVGGTCVTAESCPHTWRLNHTRSLWGRLSAVTQVPPLLEITFGIRYRTRDALTKS